MAPRIYADKVTIGGTDVIEVTGNPNGIITAARGSIAMQEDSAALWQNTDGATTWVTITGGRTYECIVDQAGNGDYLTVAAALAAGCSSIWIREGLYNEVTLNLTPGIRITGEGKDLVTISFGSAGRMIADGSGRLSTAGTISLTQNTTAVLGAGTAFLSLTTQDYIVFDGIAYRIATITDNFNMTLRTIYRGPTRGGVSYWAGSMLRGVQLSSLTMRDSDVQLLEFIQVLDIRLQDVILLGGTVTTDHIVDLEATGTVSTNANDSGWDFNSESSDIRLKGCVVRSPMTSGYVVRGLSSHVQLSNCSAYHCANFGFLVASTGLIIPIPNATNVQIDNCQAIAGVGTGFRLIGPSSGANNCTSQNNTGSGFSVNNSTLTGFIALTNAGHGIDIPGGASVIAGGRSQGNTGAGVNVQAGSTDSLIDSSYIAANGGGQVVDAGTTTLVGNIRP